MIKSFDEDEARNPYLFVVGCPRSGTTLIQRMLNAHPQLSVANDTHIIPKVLKRKTNLSLTPEMIEEVVTYRRFHRLGVSADIVRDIGKSSATFPEFMGKVYRQLAIQNGKRFGGEKTPDYVLHMPLLAGLFPASRFLHIIRDGRDVALSMLQWASAEIKGPSRFKMWKDSPLAMCAIFWKWQVDSGIKDSNRLDKDHYFEIRYEELVAEPEPVVRKVCDFLKLQFSEEMLHFHEKTAPSGGSKNLTLPPTPGLRNWRNQMDARDVEIFEAIAGDLLEQLGYELMYQSVTDEARRFVRPFLEWMDEMSLKRSRDVYPVS